MSKQKPVAIVHKTYVQKDEYKLEAVFYPPYDVKNGHKLFTEDQLKAEREKAVKLCIGIMWDTLEGENGLEIESKMLELLSTNESK
jgi:hypothetical protein